MTTLNEIHTRLADESAEIRRQGVLALEDFDMETAAPLLFEALGDEDWRVRKEAVRTVSIHATHPALLERLISATNEEENIGLKNAAREALSAAGPTVEPEVARRLSSSDPEARITAVDILGALKTENTVRLLSSALKDENLNVRVTAAEKLGEQNAAEASPLLLDALSSSSTLMRITALQSLLALGVSVPWSHLAPLLNNEVLIETLLPALGRSGAPEAVHEISAHLIDEPAAYTAMEALHDSGDTAARAVTDALSRISKEAEAFLLKLTKNDAPDLSRAAIRCLLWTRNANHIPEVVTLARRSPVYPMLIEGLREWGAPARDALCDLLEVETEHRLASVIGLLSRLLDEESGRAVAGVFARQLTSPHPAVSTAATSAVARFGDESTVPDLLPLLSIDNPRIRGAAGTALAEIGRRHPDAVRRAARALPVRGAVGVQLCRVLEVVGTPDDLDRLSEAAQATDAELRRSALRAMAAVGRAAALPYVEAALADTDMKIRLAAADALALVGPDARNLIGRSLETAEGPSAAALIRALGKVGHPRAAKILTGLCNRSADMAQCALDAAVRLEIPLDALKKTLLSHSDPEVVKAALNAVGRTMTAAELSALLSHDRWDLRLRAAEELSVRAHEEAVQRTLAAHLEQEKDDLVRAALKTGLAKGERIDA